MTGGAILRVQPGEDRAGAGRGADSTASSTGNGVAIDLRAGRLRLTGVAGLPTFNRGVADHQYLFVNGRPVKDRLLVGAVRGRLSRPARARPPPGAGAVPRASGRARSTSTSTRPRPRSASATRRRCAGLIVGGLRAALDEAGHRSARRASSRGDWRTGRSEPIAPELSGAALDRQGRDWSRAQPRPRAARHWIADADVLGCRRAAPSRAAPSRRRSRPSYPLGVARGQVAATYIVAEAEDGLVIVDQHAAHERLVLERMRAADGRRRASRARRC